VKRGQQYVGFGAVLVKALKEMQSIGLASSCLHPQTEGLLLVLCWLCDDSTSWPSFSG